MCFIHQNTAVTAKICRLSQLIIRQKVCPPQTFMKELPFFSSLSAVNDTNPLSYGKLHRNIIKQQCFSCSGKSAEPEISFSFSTNPLQDLSFNISLLRGKEILFFEKTLRFCQRRYLPHSPGFLSPMHYKAVSSLPPQYDRDWSVSPDGLHC